MSSQPQLAPTPRAAFPPPILRLGAVHELGCGVDHGFDAAGMIGFVALLFGWLSGVIFIRRVCCGLGLIRRGSFWRMPKTRPPVSPLWKPLYAVGCMGLARKN
ncbi:MAG: hypothetical protein B7X48_10110 [Acidiphilium sp. 34-60-192]|nr:MAG: hypothetical protein B7X48_10110 [Acidiphilium sp. 34-60-192]